MSKARASGELSIQVVNLIYKLLNVREEILGE